MDVLIEVLDNVADDAVLHMIHSFLPVDYYIELISHTFSHIWMFTGNTTYRKSKYHSFNDLPLVSTDVGYRYWYKNGIIHRDNDLPALIFYNDAEAWYQNGIYHRDNDLPARTFENGYQEWYRHGVQYTP